MPATRFCENCGAELSALAKFCHRCGSAIGGSASPLESPGDDAGGPSLHVLPWAIAGIAILCVLAFFAGRNWGRPAGSLAESVAADRGQAPDISQMSPEERADRLFQRVMGYVAEGKTDSVRFFAPMAIQSALSLTPLDAHRRYDLGLLAMVSGDAAMARAQADSILAGHPTHLLGLSLGMRAAGMLLDPVARPAFARRLLAALEKERATGLAEYADHAPDIDAAARDAAGESPRARPLTPPR